MQLDLLSWRRMATLHCRSREKRDERTGKLFEWSYYVEATAARAWAAEINAGRQLDPMGKPWPATVATVREP